ncbi:MAG TPA: hypothetical protein PLB32_18190 [Acidobacteriota bacterium]|nr:hypothetical protein [Acidobacteriota bacterium]
MGKNKRTRTFQSIVSEVVHRNVGRLMSKAIIANRVAKTITGTSRRTAYQVKTKALKNLASRFPEQVTIEPDQLRQELLVISVKSRNFGLHVPADLYGESI